MQVANDAKVPPSKFHSNKVRLAMVGAGSWVNKVHYPSLAAFEDIEFAGICDLNKESLHQTADKYQIQKRYTDYKKMIVDVAPDAVYVIGQPHIMYDIWTWVLEQGLNLYIEKPMGLTLHQAHTLAYLAEKRQCITQVSFQRRATPMVVMLREQCLNRGSIIHAICVYYKCSMEPLLSARDHMMDDGVHAIDTLRWMCSGEVVKIDSVTKRVGTPDINFIGAMLHFDNGATGFLINSWSSGRRIFRVEMHAPGVWVEAELEGKGRLYTEGDLDGIEYDAQEIAGSDKLHTFAGFQAKHREFIDAVKAGMQPSSNFSDAFKTMEVAEKILSQGLLQT